MSDFTPSKDPEAGEVSSIASVASSWYSPRQWHPDRNVVVRNGVIGFIDGVTVPFAITAGLSTLGMKHLVVIGGLAELVAGSMSMAFGAYLAELTEQQRYDSEAKRVKGKLREQGDNHDEEIKAILAKYRVGKSASLAVAEDLRGGDHRRTKFIMDNSFHAQRPRTSHSLFLSFAMGFAYFLGGLIPTLPYVFHPEINVARWMSISFAIFALIAFGYIKSLITLRSQMGALKGAAQTLAVGVFCAGISYALGLMAEKESPIFVFEANQRHG